MRDYNADGKTDWHDYQGIKWLLERNAIEGAYGFARVFAGVVDLSRVTRDLGGGTTARAAGPPVTEGQPAPGGGSVTALVGALAAALGLFLLAVSMNEYIDPRSRLGRHLAVHAAELDGLHTDSLAYWLRKLVFRGAWLDHRVKEGLLEVAWDENTADFGYRDPNGDRALLELAPVPSWHELQFRR